MKAAGCTKRGTRLSVGTPSLYACAGNYREGITDGSEKAQVIRWQAEEKIEGHDPKEVSGPGEKTKAPQTAAANPRRQSL